jgi:hypothetical protein
MAPRFAVEFDVANYRDMVLHEEQTLPETQIRRERISELVDPGASSLLCLKQWPRSWACAREIRMQ